MRSNRKEPFRYTFSDPVPCLFQIVILGKPVSSKGKAYIIDISLEGMKLNSELNLPLGSKGRIHLLISFKLNDQEMTYYGAIVWQSYKGTSYNYGVKLWVYDNDKERLIKHLKTYSRQHFVGLVKD